MSNPFNRAVHAAVFDFSEVFHHCIRFQIRLKNILKYTLECTEMCSERVLTTVGAIHPGGRGGINDRPLSTPPGTGDVSKSYTGPDVGVVRFSGHGATAAEHQTQARPHERRDGQRQRERERVITVTALVPWAPFRQVERVPVPGPFVHRQHRVVLVTAEIGRGQYPVKRDAARQSERGRARVRGHVTLSPHVRHVAGIFRSDGHHFCFLSVDAPHKRNETSFKMRFHAHLSPL